MIVVQLTDMHVGRPGHPVAGRVDTAARLERCVARVAALQPAPDVVVLTGVLVDLGLPEEYERLRALLAPLPCPWLLLAGNHDRRDALRAAFPDHRYLVGHDGFVQWQVDDWPLRLLALDTVVSDAVHGELCGQRLDWLRDRLGESRGRPTLLLMHHPPFPTGIGWMDAYGLLRGGDRLATIVSTHPGVERIACGHVHRPVQARFAGTLAGICPATAQQIALDLRPGAPERFMLEPPGFQIHRWHDGVLATHTVFVDDSPGPFDYR